METIITQRAIDFDRTGFEDQELLDIYAAIMKPRLIEEKMLILLRQGKITKWFSGWGQEGVSVGTALAMNQEEYILPMHRNLGIFTTRGIPLSRLFAQFQGKMSGFTKGRDRSFHFGTQDYKIVGMISHLGPQMGIADGIALANLLKQNNQATIVFTGDGGASEGDFHESLNVAAVWDLPVIFVIENNGYALSTPVHEQYRCEALVEKARGYGIDGVKIDGNNILGVYDTIKGVKKYCLEYQRPYLVECATFRMRGHEEASGTKYVPPYLFEVWDMKDPIRNYEQFLLAEQVLDEAQLSIIKQDIKEYIEVELSIGANTAPVFVDTDTELEDVYAIKPVTGNVRVIDNAQPNADLGLPASDLRLIDAIKEGLHQSMEQHGNLVLMGQDIAEYGGAFKITEGFVQDFGKERVRNTPLCESAIIGGALGLSLEGYKSMVEMQFADFVTMGFNQIVNNLAKIHYRWGQSADVVIRMPAGGGVGAGPFHSQSNEAWFTNTPGLKVVYPSTPMDAKGLLIAAINDPNPVIYFEHKALYRSVSGPVPKEYYEIEIGKARVVQEGVDISVITYGSGVHWATEYAHTHDYISFHILDLRTLLPLDYMAIRNAVARTGKVLILHEDTLLGGIGGELAAWIGEHCFDLLDAPVMRCASLDTPVPFNVELENNFLAKARLDEYIRKLINY